MYFQQQNVLHLIFIVLIALTAYLFIPGAGAFYVRYVWRSFRRRLMDAALCPPLSYRALHAAGDGAENALEGPFRFFGTIRAIQGDDTAWCSDGSLTVSVHLRGTRIYLLSSSIDENRIYEGRTHPEEPPRRISWNRLTSLPEYTRIFIYGMVRRSNGRGTFVQSEQHPLLVIIHEQEESEVFPQAVWRGRQRNEYWNIYTPGSLLVGSFSLFLYFYIIVQDPLLQAPALAALVLSVAPLLPLLPPAVVFFFFYSYFWKRGRILRAERDLLGIPALFFRSILEEPGCSERSENRGDMMTRVLPTGETYVMARVPDRDSAVSLFPDGECVGLSLPAELLEREFFVFGADHETAGVPGGGEHNGQGRLSRLVTPRDPAAAGLIVPGNPCTLSRECERRAGRLEAAGLLLFVVGAVLTGAVAFVVLGSLLF